MKALEVLYKDLFDWFLIHKPLHMPVEEITAKFNEAFETAMAALTLEIAKGPLLPEAPVDLPVLPSVIGLDLAEAGSDRMSSPFLVPASAPVAVAHDPDATEDDNGSYAKYLARNPDVPTLIAAAPADVAAAVADIQHGTAVTPGEPVVAPDPAETEVNS